MKSFLVAPFGQRIGVASSPEQLVSWYNRGLSGKKLTLKELASCDGMSCHLPKRKTTPYFAIWIDTDAPTSTLFHESLHAAHNVMDYCGVPINLGSSETQAYLMEHIAEKVLEKSK
jgi:hypothetical protein